MTELLTAYLVGMLLLAIPILLIAGEETGVRDCFLVLLIYPLWLIPLIIFYVILIIYCFIFNKSIEEGYDDIEIKFYECKFFIERLLKK